MRILAIDTTAQFGSLALLDGGRLMEEVILHEPEGFSATLFGHIQRLLARHIASLENIHAFAAAAGPGSFTGVRVGLAAIKGLAEAAGKPALAISNLAALAALGEGPLRAALIDARRGEVYGAVYDSRGVPVVPETVSKFQPWLDSLPSTALEFIGVDLSPFRTALAASRFGQCPTREHRSIARAVAWIARDRLLAEDPGDPAVIDANYVRRSDAEMLWKDRP